MSAPVNLATLSRQELRAWLANSGHEGRERAMWAWLYRTGGQDLRLLRDAGMPGALIERLRRQTEVRWPGVASERASADGTRKWLVQFADGNQVETVWIPDRGRGTLCASSQAGCALACRFCHTGTQGLARNLGASEIVGQVAAAREFLGGSPGPGQALTNIVFMGMGEPLCNYEAVASAVRILADPDGLAFAKRHIAVSTAGIVPLMERCGRELGVSLAVSLHAVCDEVRDVLMPINRKYPLAELLRACRTYPNASNRQRILFVYTLLKGVNDSESDARELVRLLAGIPCKVNLVPFNPWPGAPYEASGPDRLRAFQRIVLDGAISVRIRATRGGDILAACGQLRAPQGAAG